MQVSSTFSALKSHEKKQKPRAGSITTTPELTQCQGSAAATSSKRAAAIRRQSFKVIA
jgi:hypothetical protein